MRRLGIAAIALILIVGAISVATIGYIENRAHAAVDGGATEELVFEVPKGVSLHRLGSLLEAEGLIRSAFVWRMYVRLHPAPAPLAGRHLVRRSMNAPALLEAFARTPLSEDVPLTVLEGWRLRDIDAALAEKGLVEPGAYLAAAADPSRYTLRFPHEGGSLEGYVYPETYMIKKGPLDVSALIQRQLDTFAARFATPYKDEIAACGRSLHELVVMASMLEREEPKPEVRPNVAGILWKRLDAKHALGVDATSRYTLADWSNRKAFLGKLRDPEDTYNTRLRLGLPPTAIGAPALPSLLGALRPVASDAWYYLHDADQNIRYGKDAAEHEANRKKYNVY